MKKNLKGEAFLSLIMYLHSYPDQLTREAFKIYGIRTKGKFQRRDRETSCPRSYYFKVFHLLKKA
jgi:hypothetical protein